MGDASTPVPSVDPASFDALAVCPGSVTDLFSKATIMPPAEGSGIFNAAPTLQFSALESSLRALVQGDVSTAQSAAGTAAYELCRVDDGGSLVIVARPKQSGLGHASVAWRVAPEHKLIAEAPHAWHDASTDIQSVEAFIGLKARALILSGIYRCSSIKQSPCGSGTTTACLAWGGVYYPESDAAHNAEMLFQAAHRALSDSFMEDNVISFHGMPDSGVSISNATISDAVPGPKSLHVRLVAALQAALPSEMITSCQKYDGAPYADRWCASDNVQARYTLSSVDVCNKGATITNDRFVHMEQSKAVRAERDTVLSALRAALEAK